MNILLSLALFAICYLISVWTGGEIIHAILLYMLLRINDRIP